MQITIRFGSTNELTRTVNDRYTVGDVLNDSNIRAALGFGSNVQALVDGQVQNSSTRLEDGDLVVIETKANSKA